MFHRITGKNKTDEGSEWLSISDMMTGLMVIFLFIAISYMVQIKDTNEKIYAIAKTYSETHAALYEALMTEFEKDLDRWNAEINRETLSVTFKEPEILFNTGSAEIKPKFQIILSDFFPRYIKLLHDEKFVNDIEEVRIEGHTSSVWENETPGNAYFKNMELSQERTRAVLRYNMDLYQTEKDTVIREWLKNKITANGLSSSKLIKRQDGSEDRDRSRRVEFRVRTDAENKIIEIIDIGAQ